MAQGSKISSETLAQLRQCLVNYFSDDELATLCAGPRVHLLPVSR